MLPLFAMDEVVASAIASASLLIHMERLRLDHQTYTHRTDQVETVFQSELQLSDLVTSWPFEKVWWVLRVVND